MTVQNFEEHVTNIKNDRKSRQLCRLFLEKYVIGVGFTHVSLMNFLCLILLLVTDRVCYVVMSQVGLPARDKAGALLDLPETLVLQSAKLKDTAPDWKEANMQGLQRLFQE